MHRRMFIMKLAGRAATLCSLQMVYGCRNVVRNNAGYDVVKESTEKACGIPPEISNILYFASLAPSSHNTQPWRVRIVSDQKLIVGIDMQRRLQQVDPAGREMIISIGAFIENLVQGAMAVGYRADINIIGKDWFDPDLVEIAITRNGSADITALERIQNRRTLRKNFCSDMLKKEAEKALLTASGPDSVFFGRGSKACGWLTMAAFESMKAQTWRDAAQFEFADWFRMSPKQAALHRDGLTTDSLEITGIGGWIVKYFMNQKTVLGKTFRESQVKQAHTQSQEGAGWFVICSGDDSLPSFLDVGRRFCRMANLSHENRVAIAPMSQILEEEPWRSQPRFAKFAPVEAILADFWGLVCNNLLK